MQAPGWGPLVLVTLGAEEVFWYGRREDAGEMASGTLSRLLTLRVPSSTPASACVARREGAHLGGAHLGGPHLGCAGNCLPCSPHSHSNRSGSLSHGVPGPSCTSVSTGTLASGTETSGLRLCSVVYLPRTWGHPLGGARACSRLWGSRCATGDTQPGTHLVPGCVPPHLGGQQLQAAIEGTHSA